jgi:type I restriction enzyme S subunit
VADGIPVVPTEAIGNRQIDYSVLPKISLDKAEELRRHWLEPGDILFARRGVQATGHIGYVREVENGFVCGTGAIRLRIRRSNGISPEYVSHVLANPVSVAWFKYHAIGATMPNLNEGIIRSFPINLPLISEQCAIARILGALDDKIELNRRMNGTLEAMARALFKSWFVDFDPVRAKAEGRDSGVPKPIADLFPSRLVGSELGEIPESWDVSMIAELAGIVGGSTPSTTNPTFWQGGQHYWATPKDLSSLSAPVLLETERTITDAGVAQISSGLLPPGTVLMSSLRRLDISPLHRCRSQSIRASSQ